MTADDWKLFGAMMDLAASSGLSKDDRDTIWSYLRSAFDLIEARREH